MYSCLASTAEAKQHLIDTWQVFTISEQQHLGEIWLTMKIILILYLCIFSGCAHGNNIDTHSITTTYAILDSRITSRDAIPLLIVFKNNSNTDLNVDALKYYPYDIKVYDKNGNIIKPLPLPEGVVVLEKRNHLNIVLPKESILSLKRELYLRDVVYSKKLVPGVYYLHMKGAVFLLEKTVEEKSQGTDERGKPE